MNRERFIEELKNLNIENAENKAELYDSYYKILVEWNEFMNLTGITEYEDVLLKHFIDSVIVCNPVPDITKMKIIDIGTGAGFPGLPLKIAFPETEVMLLDSLNKRVKFLNEVITSLGLSGIRAIHSRAEEGARNKELREKYDCCVSRAVANLSSLSEYCLPYVKVGGIFVAYKSGEIDEEVKNSTNAVKILGGKVLEVKKLRLPDSDIDRSFVIIKKIKQTPGKYPRKSGTPAKEPL